MPGAGYGTDQQLLICKMKLKLKTMRKPKPVFRYELDNIAEQFHMQVANRYECLNGVDRQPDELWENLRNILKQEAEDNMPKRTKKKMDIMLYS